MGVVQFRRGGNASLLGGLLQLLTGCSGIVIIFCAKAWTAPDWLFSKASLLDSISNWFAEMAISAMTAGSETFAVCAAGESDVCARTED
jgi:hypothetical protein